MIMQYHREFINFFLEVIKMIADRIKELRESRKITQSELAQTLGITRSSVNAWELGISVPSTQYIVELSNYFSVSTDYLLGVKPHSTISLEGLSDKDIILIYQIVNHLRDVNDLGN